MPLIDLYSVRDKANRAPLYLPRSDIDFRILFEPFLFDPYVVSRVDYLRSAGFFTYERDSDEQRAILDIARRRMENHSSAGFVPSLANY